MNKQVNFNDLVTIGLVGSMKIVSQNQLLFVSLPLIYFKSLIQ